MDHLAGYIRQSVPITFCVPIYQPHDNCPKKSYSDRSIFRNQYDFTYWCSSYPTQETLSSPSTINEQHHPTYPPQYSRHFRSLHPPHRKYPPRTKNHPWVPMCWLVCKSTSYYLAYSPRRFHRNKTFKHRTTENLPLPTLQRLPFKSSEYWSYLLRDPMHICMATPVLCWRPCNHYKITTLARTDDAGTHYQKIRMKPAHFISKHHMGCG